MKHLTTNEFRLSVIASIGIMFLLALGNSLGEASGFDILTYILVALYVTKGQPKND